jgi:hypothetical protein
METKFEVSYDRPKFKSQKSVSASGSSQYKHLETCRPKFSYETKILNLAPSGDNLMMDLALETATTGAQNCEEMFAEILVYEIIKGQEDRLVVDIPLNDEKLKAYSIDSAKDVKK